VSSAHGASLVAELERRFVVGSEHVPLGGSDIALLKPRSAEDLISEEDFERDERLPYWAELWPSARVLAARMLEEAGNGRRLLELGCGVGLVAIAAMRAGFDMLATDYYADALQFTRANAWRILGHEPRTRLVDWRDLPSDLGRFDLVVAADVLYERPYAQIVSRVLAETLAPGGRALIADPGRVAINAFLAACEADGMSVVHSEARPYEAGEIRQTIRLFTIAPSSR
jgi:predicted nicotinamide N-methyase